MSQYNINARKIFVDLDGVCFNFDTAKALSGLSTAEFKLLPGIYRDLLPYAGVSDHLITLQDCGFDIWLVTNIPHANPNAATEKLLAVTEHFPSLSKSVIITPNKGILGARKDFLIDDCPRKAHAEDFEGEFLRFGPQNQYKTWQQVMVKMLAHKPDGNIVYDVIVGNCVVPVRAEVKEYEYVLYSDIPQCLEVELREFLDDKASYNCDDDNAIIAPFFERFALEYNRS